MITNYFPLKKSKVVHIKRKDGRVIQDCDIYIGRKCIKGGWDLKNSKWANPFSVKECGSHKIACKKYKDYILERPDLLNNLHELKGKVLGCWCKPKPCHGDVLIELLVKFF